MNIVKMILSLFGKHKKTAKKLMDEHGDKIDMVTTAIPGETDDKIVDQAREALDVKK